MDECIHGMDQRWCGVCTVAEDRGVDRRGSSGLHGGETKQDVLNDITDLLALPRATVSVGSSLPSDVFAAAARRVGVPGGTMPEVCEQIVRSAGQPYHSSFDSRSTISGGGSTVTLEGVQAMRRALQTLLVSSHRAPGTGR